MSARTPASAPGPGRGDVRAAQQPCVPPNPDHAPEQPQTAHGAGGHAEEVTHDPDKPRNAHDAGGQARVIERYPHRAALAEQVARLRSALTKLGRSPRPLERDEGDRIAAEALAVLTRLSDQAEKAHAPTLRRRKRDADLARKLAKGRELLAARGDQPVTTPPVTSTDEIARRYGTGGETEGTP